ncbi:MAG: sigma-70 family RNA polymerase sigma factor [Anaerolineae bacterium]|nr:sigma-70 family RNA polymerase sigma factor [Anaerolineae bacterium]
MDETSLIHAAQKGDLEAFNRIVVIYQGMAYNLAYRILNNDTLAEDATQNAFISAYRNLSKYRGGSFRAWILRVVTNYCYDELRRQKRRPTIPLEPLDDDSEETLESPRWLTDDAPGPEETLVTKELEKAVQHCLDRLPANFRTVVILVDIQGLDYQEVSETIRTPLGTIKSRLARARLRMQDCLQGFRELLPSAFRLVNEVQD